MADWKFTSKLASRSHLPTQCSWLISWLDAHQSIPNLAVPVWENCESESSRFTVGASDVGHRIGTIFFLSLVLMTPTPGHVHLNIFYPISVGLKQRLIYCTSTSMFFLCDNLRFWLFDFYTIIPYLDHMPSFTGFKWILPTSLWMLKLSLLNVLIILQAVLTQLLSCVC